MLESLNAGKTIADSLGDMQGVANTLRYYGGWTDKVEGRTPPVRGNFLTYTLRQPSGVVGQIIPWNFPLLMLAWKLGPAIACGNTVVLKPAEQTPLTALRLAELAMEAGFPPGILNIVNGVGEVTGATVVVHPDVDKIVFTGHVDTAKIIQKAAADTLKRTSFELGGKSPTSSLPTLTWIRQWLMPSTRSTSTQRVMIWARVDTEHRARYRHSAQGNSDLKALRLAPGYESAGTGQACWGDTANHQRR